MAGLQMNSIKNIVCGLKSIQYNAKIAANTKLENQIPKIVTPKSVLINNMSRNPELTYENYLHPFLTKTDETTSTSTKEFDFAAKLHQNTTGAPSARAAMDEVFKRWNQKPKKDVHRDWLKFNIMS